MIRVSKSGLVKLSALRAASLTILALLFTADRPVSGQEPGGLRTRGKLKGLSGPPGPTSQRHRFLDPLRSL